MCRPQMNQPVQSSEITIMKPVTYVQMRYKETIVNVFAHGQVNMRFNIANKSHILHVRS